ncbi:beta-lactamase domain-containing protein [Alcanivorax hongdengensis A-11-3]|uniref:Beta-lactamase domain-containing protein n=1 Tax=Alcanivorax hongdengensis A-11-3 TaxID=1177179 RepID=L0WGD4_9GAMM|nr:beta-lactamase domain-containing protein [Alcanivorax hongdengensis A-11-3]
MALLFVYPNPNQWQQVPAQPAAQPGQVTVTWLGTATLLISDGKTHLLTDGYFTRSSLDQILLSDLSSDPQRIQQGLKQAHIDNLDAVMVLHSHFDHAMDSARVAELTGARLLGSHSTAMTAKGAHLDDHRVTTVDVHKPYHFGDFTVTFVPARHVPLPAPVEALTGKGQIHQPLEQPAPVGAWQEGHCYALVIQHPNGSLLIQGSAGDVAGALDYYRADYAFVASASLGKQSEHYQKTFMDNTVNAVHARTVIPIHWDNFFAPLSANVKPLPLLLDNMDKSFRAITSHFQGDFQVLPPTHTMTLTPPAGPAPAPPGSAPAR